MTDFNNKVIVLKPDHDNRYRSDEIDFELFNDISNEIAVFSASGIRNISIGVAKIIDKKIELFPIDALAGFFNGNIDDISLAFIKTECTAFDGATSDVYIPILQELYLG